MMENQKFPITIAAVSLALISIAYFVLYLPEITKREAIQVEILSAARSLQETDCRKAMLEEGIEESKYENNGGFVDFRKLDRVGTVIRLVARFKSDRDDVVLCDVSINSLHKVSVWSPTSEFGEY